MKVKGYAVKVQGKPLEPFEYEAPPVGDTEVLVEISHCGICHTDLHFIDNEFGMTSYPFVPGHEIVGTVTARGSAVRNLKEGERVGIGFSRGSCGHCEWCVRGEDNLCPDAMRYMTFVPYGGFSSAIVADSRLTFPIPQAIDSEHAAPLMCGGVTVYSPFRTRGIRPGMKVGVIGIGGLGHLALQFARAWGCEVTAFSATPAKEKEARRFGAHHFVSSTDEAALDKAAGTMDFIISTSPKHVSWKKFMNTLRKRGTLCLVGLTMGDIAVDFLPLLLGEQSLCASDIGGRASMVEMLEFAARTGIRPVVEAVPLSEVNRAIARLKQGAVRYRAVLRI
jgi:uncharacterized zinc-type alcohol dehydrogenase-like protein